MSLLCMALAEPGGGGGVVHRQPGRHRDRHRAHPGQDPRGPGRPAHRGAGRGHGPGGGRLPGGLDRPGRHHPRPGRLDTTAVALAAALGADACEIYTDVTGVFSADPRVVPDARRLSRISFEEMLEIAATGGRVLAAALGRVRPQPPRAPARPLELHLGAGHLGRRGGSVHGAGRRHRRHPRHLGGQGDRDRRARPPRGSPPGCSGPWPTGRSTST